MEQKRLGMQKKAQLYIIVSVAIAVVVAGLITIINYALVKPEPVEFYDLSKQLENEANRVIDYGVYSEDDISLKIEDFIRDFLVYAHEKDAEIGLIYIYGNTSELIIVNYGKDDAGIITELNKTVLSGGEALAVSQIRIDIAGKQVGKKIIEEKSIFGNIKAYFGAGKMVIVNMTDDLFKFNLRGEQYFFAIVKSERDGETYYRCLPLETC